MENELQYRRTGGVSVFGNGGNAGANLGSDISISSATGEIQVYFNGWSVVFDSWDTANGPRGFFRLLGRYRAESRAAASGKRCSA
jgi:hypothetical protein